MDIFEGVTCPILGGARLKREANIEEGYSEGASNAFEMSF